jgi:hypothetical protein
MTPPRPNPMKLNPLQLKTLAIMQALAREPDLADAPDEDGNVRIHSLPHVHGNHVHLGGGVVAMRDMSGLGNPSVLNALARKGLLKGGERGAYTLTGEGLGYDTGIARQVLQGTDH